jgi:hypothetical protein
MLAMQKVKDQKTLYLAANFRTMPFVDFMKFRPQVSAARIHKEGRCHPSLGGVLDRERGQALPVPKFSNIT